MNQNGEIQIELKHKKTDKFNAIWYIMNDLFTLEQMRTVLTVNGIYNFKVRNGDIVKIRNHEYVFNKYTSYDTFVFNMENYSVKPQTLYVEDSKKILKKSRFLYLFGGIKTFYLLCTVALIATLIAVFINGISSKDITLIVVLGIIVLIGLLNYLNSIKFLKIYLSEKNIKDYMNSGRKEYRKFTDNLIEDQLYLNNCDDVYK